MPVDDEQADVEDEELEMESDETGSSVVEARDCGDCPLALCKATPCLGVVAPSVANSATH
jgi:hypothetical protein